jgi:two-component system sensor histidine kinase UhpB
MNSSIEVLLVEDNDAAAALIISELTHSHFGPFSITRVVRLAEAMGCVERNPVFDVVLLDLGLPDSQGMGTLERLHNQTPHAIPIVILTGSEEENMRSRSLRAGAEEYLGKGESAGSLRTRAIRSAVDHKRVCQAMAVSEQRLEMALDSANIGVFDRDLRTGQVHFQQSRLFGFKPAEFDGSYEALERRVHPDDQQRRLEAIRHSIAALGEYQCEYRVIWPDLTEHWVEARGRVLKDDAGAASRMLGTVMDVSTRKAAEQAAAIKAAEAMRLSSARLTARELEMLKLISAGLPNKRIAMQLNISIRTVAKHRSNLMAKTKALNAADLARMTALAGV